MRRKDVTIHVRLLQHIQLLHKEEKRNLPDITTCATGLGKNELNMNQNTMANAKPGTGGNTKRSLSNGA